MVRSILIGLLLLIASFIRVEGHVSLTFPLARKYQFDYLDNGSLPPCGMPKGSIKTSLISGSTINITWHLGYPHRGVHSLELLASNGTKLFTLAAEEDNNDPTAQRHQVELPSGFTCNGCIIRLLRESGELGSSHYRFRSCADVDIVQPVNYIETCSKNGQLNKRFNGFCQCQPRFWGEHCQYEDECVNDSDCGGFGHGKCIDIQGTTLPRKQCFCNYGYIGTKCTKQNAVGKFPLPTQNSLTKEYLARNYLSQVLGPRISLFWRLLEGSQLQIEFVLKVNGTSYAALGWRPIDFQGDCTRYPNDAIFPSANSGTGEGGRHSRFGRQTDRNQSSSEQPKQRLQQRPRRRLHPMACMDVIIGAARGNTARILDYWSSDISTPHVDTFFESGSDDIQAGAGWESPDGITTLVFRILVLPDDITDEINDWPLDEPLFMIFARGQEPGEYIHLLPSGVDKGQPASVPNFYTQDELKYHGSDEQRGAFQIHFLEEGSRDYFKTRAFN